MRHKKNRFNDKSDVLSKPVTFDSDDSLKILLTIKESGKGKRPHQAFLVLREPTTGLETPFPLTVKDNGKATVEIVRPVQTTQYILILLHSNAHNPLTETRRPPRPIRNRRQTCHGLSPPSLVWLVRGSQEGHIRRRDHAEPGREAHRLREAPALRQVGGDPSHLPRRPQEPPQGHIARLCVGYLGYRTGSLHRRTF